MFYIVRFPVGSLNEFMEKEICEKLGKAMVEHFKISIEDTALLSKEEDILIAIFSADDVDQVALWLEAQTNANLNALWLKPDACPCPKCNYLKESLERKRAHIFSSVDQALTALLVLS